MRVFAGQLRKAGIRHFESQRKGPHRRRHEWGDAPGVAVKKWLHVRATGVRLMLCGPDAHALSRIKSRPARAACQCAMPMRRARTVRKTHRAACACPVAGVCALGHEA